VTIALAVDVGATAIKWQPFNDEGEVRSARRRRTPSPCHPDALLDIIGERAKFHQATFVAVGFPGDVIDGVVTDPANLARVAGPGSPVAGAVAQAWEAFPLRERIVETTGARCLVVNDAVATTAGCDVQRGRHLVITLGTGVGVALAADGMLLNIDDVGGRMFGELTFDETVGEAARAQDPTLWIQSVVATIAHLREQFDIGTIHVAGGNAKRLSPQEFAWLNLPVIIERSMPALVGLNRLRLVYPSA